MSQEQCGCIDYYGPGDPDDIWAPINGCAHFDSGYPWCRACLEHHRSWPGCPGITQDGEAAGGEMDLEGVWLE